MKKKICIALINFFLFVGCEPSFRIYVKNSTVRSVDLTLIQDREILHATDTVYAYFEHDLIHNIKWSTADKFTQRKKIERLIDSTYHIILCSHSTYLISSGMHQPFRKIVINQEHRIDTLIRLGKNKNIHKNMEQIKVFRKGFWNEATIIELF